MKKSIILKLLLSAIFIIIAILPVRYASAGCVSLEEGAYGHEYWQNICGYRVYILFTNERSCRPQNHASYPCADDVGPYGKSTALANQGQYYVYECENGYWPIEESWGVVRCYPHNQDTSR